MNPSWNCDVSDCDPSLGLIKFIPSNKHLREHGIMNFSFATERTGKLDEDEEVLTNEENAAWYNAHTSTLDVSY